MTNLFVKESINIADSFIKSVCFIDDEPFFKNSENPRNEDPDHRLDAKSITKAFALKGKSCSFFMYENENEESEVLKLAENTDINVIDWRIHLTGMSVQDLDDEDDVPDEEVRGKYALKLIDKIITGFSNSPKLIVILTGENDADSVYSPLRKKLTELNLGFQENEEDLSFQNNKHRVCIYFKEALANRKVSNDVRLKIAKNTDLPDILIKEFALLTNGLVSNAVIKSISIIRDNTATLLDLFNKELDPAFLGHRVLLPAPEDSEELLIELIRDSIGDLLHYHNVKSTVSQEQVLNWIDCNISEEQRGLKGLNNEKKLVELGANFVRTKNLARNLLTKDFKAAWSGDESYKALSKDNKTLFKKYYELNTTEYFTPSGVNHKDLDVKYARLTHHKSLFKPALITPKLSLGAVIKGDKSGYWVCIQQRCDSVRLEKDEIRRFLFLPLKNLEESSTQRFHFVTPDGVKLQLNKKSFSLRTIKFVDTNGEGVIKATLKPDGAYIFAPFYSEGNKFYKAEQDETFKWILDLKDLHAQRIAHEFATELSRVGLNESEWLRRWSS